MEAAGRGVAPQRRQSDPSTVGVSTEVMMRGDAASVTGTRSVCPAPRTRPIASRFGPSESHKPSVRRMGLSRSPHHSTNRFRRLTSATFLSMSGRWSMMPRRAASTTRGVMSLCKRLTSQ